MAKRLKNRPSYTIHSRVQLHIGSGVDDDSAVNFQA